MTEIQNTHDYMTGTYTLTLIEGKLEEKIEIKKKQYLQVEDFLKSREKYLKRKKEVKNESKRT